MVQNANGLIVLPLIVFLSSLPLTFVALSATGGLNLNPAHATLLCLVMAAGLVRPHDFVVPSLMRSIWIFSVCFAIYLLVLASSGFLNHADKGEFGVLFKYFSYFCMFLLLVIILKSPLLPNEAIAKGVYWGCSLGVVVFLLFATVVFWRSGRSFPREFAVALFSGDVEFLRFGIFLSLLNYSTDEVVQRSDTFVAISRVNTFMGTFVLFLQLVWVYRRAALVNLPRMIVNIVSWGVTLFSIVLIVGSTSRTNLVAVFFAGFTAMMSRFMSSRSSTQIGNIAWVVLFMMSVLFVVVLVLAPSLGILDMLAQRFSWETLQNDSRSAQYFETWERIKQRPLTGYGLGASVDLTADGGRVGQRVHNILLASWYEAGLAGLAASLLFYGFLLSLFIAEIRAVVLRSGFSSSGQGISWYWVLGLPCLPLLRAMLAGQGGNFSFVEWICLAFFFAAISRMRQPQRIPILHQERSTMLVSRHVHSAEFHRT